MKRIAILCLIVLSSLGHAQSLHDRLSHVFDELNTKPKWPGVAVLVRKDGKTIYQGTSGIRDQRTHTPITETTNFRLASCTKQFTAMAVMLLMHDGKLGYDDYLSAVFPDFPAYGRSITIRNLLNHTSGLPDYEDLMSLPTNKNRWSATHQISDAEVLTLLESADKAQFAAGTQWSYSNSGYVVLGLVVAKVSGMSFPEFLRTRIFAPLKMTRTVAYVHGKNTVPERAYGFEPQTWSSNFINDPHPFPYFEQDQSSTSATLGDGGVYSNLVDLAKWDDALAHHTLLSEEEMRPPLTPFKLPNGELPKWSGDSGDTDPQAGKPVAYGFGWFLDPLIDAAGNPLPRMWHYGDTVGFRSVIMRFSDGRTIIVLTNIGNLDAAALATKAALSY